MPRTDAFDAAMPASLAPLALSDWQSSSVLDGVQLPLCTQQASARRVRVLVSAANAVGGVSWAASAPVELSTPSFTSLMESMRGASSGGASNDTFAVGGGGAAAIVSTVLNQSLAMLSPPVDVRNGSAAGSSDLLPSVLSTVSSVAMMLDVIACGSRDCGSGTCVVSSSGPTCNCTGTGFVSDYCSEPLRGDSGVAPGIDPESSAVASPSTLPMVLPLAEKQCPSAGSGECSGHGVCVRDRSPCVVGALDCSAMCRFVPTRACVCVCGMSHRGH